MTARDIGPPRHFPKALNILGENEVNRPLPWDSLTKNQKQFQSRKMAIHAEMIHRMDIEIGRVLALIMRMPCCANLSLLGGWYDWSPLAIRWWLLTNKHANRLFSVCVLNINSY